MSVTNRIIAQVVEETDNYLLNVIEKHIIENPSEYEILTIPKSKVNEIFKLGLAEYTKQTIKKPPRICPCCDGEKYSDFTINHVTKHMECIVCAGKGYLE